MKKGRIKSTHISYEKDTKGCGLEYWFGCEFNDKICQSVKHNIIQQARFPKNRLLLLHSLPTTSTPPLLYSLYF